MSVTDASLLMVIRYNDTVIAFVSLKQYETSVKVLFQAPFYHFIIEGLLLLWIIRLLFFKSYKIHANDPPTEAEKEELIREWKPEPLAPPLEKTLAENEPYRVVTGCVCVPF